MARYTISLFEGLDDRWLEAARDSDVLPTAVEHLLGGQAEEEVHHMVLDAILEWDRSIARRLGLRPEFGMGYGIDFWPASDVPFKPFDRGDARATRLTGKDADLLKGDPAPLKPMFKVKVEEN